jgi:four helix bundle protein
VPKGDDIAARLVKFAAGVVALVSDTPRDAAGRHIATQLLRSATGSGANYEEARGAESVRDFVHKLRLADKEMREARYWLDLVAASWSGQSAIAHELSREANELVAILSSSIRTASRRLDSG